MTAVLKVVRKLAEKTEFRIMWIKNLGLHKTTKN